MDVTFSKSGIIFVESMTKAEAASAKAWADAHEGGPLVVVVCDTEHSRAKEPDRIFVEPPKK